MGELINNTYAADVYYKAHYDCCGNIKCSTIYTYQIELGKAISKSDLRTAIEAMDFWINFTKKLGAYSESLEQLTYYRNELSHGKLHEKSKYIASERGARYIDTGLQMAQRGELDSRFSCLLEDKYFSRTKGFDDGKNPAYNSDNSSSNSNSNEVIHKGNNKPNNG